MAVEIRARRPTASPSSRTVRSAVRPAINLPAELFSPAVTGAVGFAAVLGLDDERFGEQVADLVPTGMSLAASRLAA